MPQKTNTVPQCNQIWCVFQGSDAINGLIMIKGNISGVHPAEYYSMGQIIRD